jgi:GRAM domain-containing protein
MNQVYQPQNEGEKLIGTFRANLWRGFEAVGGRLVLTNQRVLFEAHNFNFQTTPVAIPLSAIETVAPSLTFGIIPNGLTIHCSDKTYKFVVSGRNRIISKLQECGIRIGKQR